MMINCFDTELTRCRANIESNNNKKCDKKAFRGRSYIFCVALALHKHSIINLFEVDKTVAAMLFVINSD